MTKKIEHPALMLDVIREFTGLDGVSYLTISLKIDKTNVRELVNGLMGVGCDFKIEREDDIIEIVYRQPIESWEDCDD